MQLLKAVTLAATVGTVASLSICDKYTVALLKTNSAANQYTLLTLLVNTVVIGNFTGPGTKNPTLPGSMNLVPGILAPGMYNGESVSLAKYFDGALASTNFGSGPVAVNWLDGGGATPIIADPTSSGTKGSHQATLLMHLYSFFGALLGCSKYGTTGFPAYAGQPSMYSVHQSMDIDTAELSYFIEQVGLAATSFGASKSDVDTVAKALNSTFGYRCSPPAAVIPADGPQLQAMCIASSCPKATSGAVCGSYKAAVAPMPASSSMAAATSSSAPMVSQINDGQPQASTPVIYTGAAAPAKTAMPVALAGLAGIAALAL